MTRLSSGLLLCSFLVISLDYVRPFPNFLEIEEFERINRPDPKRGDPRCRQCATKQECFSEPRTPSGLGCRWGTFEDRCGHINCLRGPEEFCDMHSALDRCSSDLICTCNECRGCTRDEYGNYKCFYGKQCLNEQIARNPKYK